MGKRKELSSEQKRIMHHLGYNFDQLEYEEWPIPFGIRRVELRNQEEDSEDGLYSLTTKNLIDDLEIIDSLKVSGDGAEVHKLARLRLDMYIATLRDRLRKHGIMLYRVQNVYIKRNKKTNIPEVAAVSKDKSLASLPLLPDIGRERGMSEIDLRLIAPLMVYFFNHCMLAYRSIKTDEMFCDLIRPWIPYIGEAKLQKCLLAAVNKHEPMLLTPKVVQLLLWDDIEGSGNEKETD